jgi:molecular chaperone GrpE
MTSRKKKIGTTKKTANETTPQPGAHPIESDVLPKTTVDAEKAGVLPLDVESAEVGRDSDLKRGSGSQSEGSEITKTVESEKLIEELREQYLRARAEADNIRKRAEIEIGNARKFALEGFARELLSVKDSLELARAVDLESASGDIEIAVKVMEGLNLTIKQLEAAFEQFSIDEVNPEPGDKLDPERHQAMSMEETTEIEPSRICRVIQRGYLLHDRLLRPAMVIVAKAPKVLD